MHKKVVLICGMPRSGTSWLGQIFDSSPDVAFRMEPLFAYAFKNVLDEDSSKEAVSTFLDKVYLTNDEFILQKENRSKGNYTDFEKRPTPSHLVIKTTRHHNLVKSYLAAIDNIDVVAVVRHPCASIYSWISTDREFSAKGCQLDKDWRSGGCRKDDVGEFWGFDDWLEVTQLHVELDEEHDNFHLVRYADLVTKLIPAATDLFETVSLKVTKQTREFLINSQERHVDDPYAVFKSPAVKDKWKNALDEKIAAEIIDRTTRAGLDKFLV